MKKKEPVQKKTVNLSLDSVQCCSLIFRIGKNIQNEKPLVILQALLQIASNTSLLDLFQEKEEFMGYVDAIYEKISLEAMSQCIR